MTQSAHILGLVVAGSPTLHRILSLANDGIDKPRYGLPLAVMGQADFVIDLVRKEFIKNRIEDPSRTGVSPTMQFLFENCPLEHIISATSGTFTFVTVDL